MKVCIVAPSPVPFTPGGAERLFAGLAEAISARHGVDAEVVKLPSRERNFADLVESYTAFSTLDLSHFDLVVSTKYPSWMVDHSNHVVYMVHPLRGVYDSYHHFGLPVELEGPLPGCVQTLRGHLDAGPRRSRVGAVLAQAKTCVDELGTDDPLLGLPSPLLRLLLQWLDAAALNPTAIVRHLAISETVAGRPGYFPTGAWPIAVVPPSSMPVSEPGAGSHPPFLFTASRLHEPKRIGLIIDAMNHVQADIELRIAGAGPEEEALGKRASGDRRVKLIGRLSEQELSQAYADAKAVVFVPLDEDLGLITLEAQVSGTPVITVTDAGGPTELIENGVSGLITEADPLSLAASIDDLVGDDEMARQIGEAGRTAAAVVTWDRVVDAILGTSSSSALFAGSSRRRIVVLSTYPVDPARGGGQLRCRHLFEPLGRDRDVVVLCLGLPGEPASRRILAPGVLQIMVPRSDAHLAAEARVEACVGLPVTDIAASMFIELSPAYLRELKAAVDSADIAILAQPYLLPALRMVAPGLAFIYDSQNDEVTLKRELLPDTAAGNELVDVVSVVEGAAARNGTVTACSPDELRGYEIGDSHAAPTLIPNGADVSGTPFVDLGERLSNLDHWRHTWVDAGGAYFQHLAIFVGSWHPPNLDAVEMIIDFAPACPDIMFLVAGSQCDYFRGRELPRNIVMRGPVSEVELSLLLRTADIALNPMRLGAGTNLKILEYFAAGVPVVSTAVGARGTGARPGVEYFEFVGADDLPLTVERAVDQSSAREAVAHARLLVESDFDWTVLAERFRAVVEDVVAQGADQEGLPTQLG